MALSIRHHLAAAGGLSIHTFTASEPIFTLGELKAARITSSRLPPLPTEPMVIDGRPVIVRTPFHRFVFNHRSQTLEHRDVFPYPSIYDASGTLARQSKAGGRGHGTTFDRKTYEFLSRHYPADTPVLHGNPLFPIRREYLKNSGLYDSVHPRRRFTLGECADAFRRREAELEERHGI